MGALRGQIGANGARREEERQKYCESKALRVAGGSARYARSQGRIHWNDRQNHNL